MNKTAQKNGQMTISRGLNGNQIWFSDWHIIIFSYIYFSRQLNFPGASINSMRFPGFPGVVDTLLMLQLRSRSLPVVCTADNALAVEPNASDKLLMTFQYPQTCSTVHVPQPDSHFHTAEHTITALKCSS